MDLPPRPTKDVSDLSWVSRECPDVLHEWAIMNTLIRSIVLPEWVFSRLLQSGDPTLCYGFIAADPTHPEALQLTWMITSVTHVSIFGTADAAFRVFLTDDYMDHPTEGLGVFFGQHHRTINRMGASREIPCTSEGSAEMRIHVQKLARALVRGEWPSDL